MDPRFARLVPDPTALHRISDGSIWSEGPVWLPDENALPWSDIPNDRVMRWSAPDGTVRTRYQPSDFANGHTLDHDGTVLADERTLYASDTSVGRVENGHHHIVASWTSAGDGVHVLAPSAEELGRIPTPEKVGNVTFGGPDGRTLFICASSTIWSMDVAIRGATTWWVEGGSRP